MVPPAPGVLTAVLFQVACEFGVLRVVPQSGGTRGRDYCILYNPQWAHLPHDLNKVVSVILGTLPGGPWVAAVPLGLGSHAQD